MDHFAIYIINYECIYFMSKLRCYTEFNGATFQGMLFSCIKGVSVG